MARQGFRPALLLSALLLGSLPALPADAPAPSHEVSRSNGSDLGKAPAPRKAKAKKEKPATAAETQVVLGDGFIVQNSLRVYLGRPAAISLYNARGQLLYHAESSRPMETVPLNGVNAGFLYLTLRAGQLELTKKLVYSGK